jgi:CelD/BcsL family acetyltransferase involved in cellulose biosynthesis
MLTCRQPELLLVQRTETASGRAATIETRIVEDTAGFERLREEWTELLEASDSNGLFLTWEWLFSWWKHLSGGRRLHIVTVRSGRQLVAIAPLVLRPPGLLRLLPFRALEFLGSGIVGSDYLDFIIRRGREQEACRTLADYLREQKLMLELTQLSRSSCRAAMVAAQLQQEAWILSEAKVNVCPFIRLSGHSWESYLASLGSEHRYNVGRRMKTLAKRFKVRFERAHSDDQRRVFLGLLVALHNRRWQDRRGCSEAFYTPSLLSFHEEVSRLALERGWLRLFTLQLDGHPAAALYGFRYRRTFSFFQSGFDPAYGKHSVGLVTLGLTIKSAIEEGVEEYDLLHGDEPYKFHWAHEVHELGRLDLYPPGARGQVYKGTRGMSRVIRRMGRLVLPKTIADRLAIGKDLGLWSRLYAAKTR